MCDIFVEQKSLVFHPMICVKCRCKIKPQSEIVRCFKIVNLTKMTNLSKKLPPKVYFSKKYGIFWTKTTLQIDPIGVK